MVKDCYKYSDKKFPDHNIWKYCCLHTSNGSLVQTFRKMNILYLPRSIVKSSLFCGRPGDADVGLRISLNSTSSMVLGLGVMSESDDVLSLRGGEILPKSEKSCPNRRLSRSSSSLLLV